MLAGQHLAHDLGRRIVGIDRHHLGAVDHDVRDFQFVQIEDGTETIAVVADHRTVAVQDFDGAANFLVRAQQGAAASIRTPSRRSIQRAQAEVAAANGDNIATAKLTERAHAQGNTVGGL